MIPGALDSLLDGSMMARFGGAIERFLPQGGSLISPAGRKLEELVGHHITLKQKDGTKRTGKLAAPSSTSGWSSGTVTLHDVELAVNGQRALAKKCNFHVSDIDYIDGPATESFAAEVGSMRCWGCGALERGVKYQCCGQCQAENLIVSCFCSKDCLRANWPRHKKWHEEQRTKQEEHQVEKMKYTDEGRVTAELHHLPPQVQQRYVEFIEQADALIEQGKYSAAKKKLNKAIAIAPSEPNAITKLGLVYRLCNDRERALEYYLVAVEKAKPGTQSWGWALSSAFNELMQPAMQNAPKPSWWNDASLLAMAEQVIVVDPTDSNAWKMHGEVLCCGADLWNVGPRTAKALRRAAKSFERAAHLTAKSSVKLWMQHAVTACHQVVGDRANDDVIEGACSEFAKAIRAITTMEQLEKTGIADVATFAAPGHRPSPGEDFGAFTLSVQQFDLSDPNHQAKLRAGPGWHGSADSASGVGSESTDPR